MDNTKTGAIGIALMSSVVCGLVSIPDLQYMHYIDNDVTGGRYRPHDLNVQ